MKIEVLPTAVKEFENLPRSIQRQIASKITGLAKDPFPASSKPLKGENTHRLRSGDYRILYAVDTRAQTVTIVKIRHRKDAYRNL
ncbi:MAG: type II toxin-antitoxin system RelE/ParE family toxin [Nitrospinae bacterium]|nr:type II toxin-antitoxin system RelE/ParE family toxin [Nitrospinota bacterium]